MKIEFFKKRNNFKKKKSDFNPNFYWELSIFTAFVIMIASFFFGYYLFTQINQEPTSSTINTDGQVPTVDKNRIENDLNYFSEREQKSTDISNSPSPVVDPSL
jgi:hypothetical protein